MQTVISSKQNFPEPIPASQCEVWKPHTPESPQRAKSAPPPWGQPAARSGGSAIVFTLCSDKLPQQNPVDTTGFCSQAINQCLGGWLPKHMNSQKQSHFHWQTLRNICSDFEGCFRHIPFSPFQASSQSCSFAHSFAQICSRSSRLQ